MNNHRTMHGLIDPEIHMPGESVPPNKTIYGKGHTTIVFDSYETEKAALEIAWGDRQRRAIMERRWDVDGKEWNLRQRMERAGFEFEALGREYVNSPMIYKIRKAGGAAA
ncbi:hypothetical protein GCM10007989_13420 [Devosia pacifica]|uniref:Uncharacterized protein n=1 Tax=Devosia pacifica TaxID=1335967 RepID=A0A918S143_9HYPH|nr:hypothetical protein [Devosia pacifica]GHA19241.1 hypothetical protein GCM10007989_13420 [Devosia pacifica]